MPTVSFSPTLMKPSWRLALLFLHPAPISFLPAKLLQNGACRGEHWPAMSAFVCLFSMACPSRLNKRIIPNVLESCQFQHEMPASAIRAEKWGSKMCCPASFFRRGIIPLNAPQQYIPINQEKGKALGYNLSPWHAGNIPKQYQGHVQPTTPLLPPVWLSQCYLPFSLWSPGRLAPSTKCQLAASPSWSSKHKQKGCPGCCLHRQVPVC